MVDNKQKSSDHLQSVIDQLQQERHEQHPQEVENEYPDKSMTPDEKQQFEKYKQEMAYEFLVDQVKPKPTIAKNCVWAFVVGGLICVLGQLIQNYFLYRVGLVQTHAAAATTFIMIFLGAFLTGLGIYDEIGRRAGAGSVVPITGFANSIVSSAMEAKREGYIYGVGAKIFTVAGPVLVYGLIASTLIALIAYFFI